MTFNSLESIFELPDLSESKYLEYSYIDCIDKLYTKNINLLVKNNLGGNSLFIKEQTNQDRVSKISRWKGKKAKILSKSRPEMKEDISAKILRWKAKKAKILMNNSPYKYECRSMFASNRQRVKGRFI